MPRNQLQRMIFALLTVIITVSAFVFYNTYVIEGNALMAANNTNSVLSALRLQGGIYMFNTILPIWVVWLIEFGCAYCLELVLGGPLSFKIASKMFNPSKNHPGNGNYMRNCWYYVSSNEFLSSYFLLSVFCRIFGVGVIGNMV